MGEFLLGIDLEDVSCELAGVNQYSDRIPKMTEKILVFLSSHQSSATFFTTGDIARRFPTLVNDIVNAGHEIACHSDLHRPLKSFTEKQFKEDLDRNISLLLKAGAKKILGYRAPFYSMTEDVQWAYKILNQSGIIYSSSVLPAANPIFGWKDFGEDVKRVNAVLEIPISMIPYSYPKIPFAGGVYFKVFPRFVIGRLLAHSNFKTRPVVGYLHPQDIDSECGTLVYKDYSAFFNFILNFNKSTVLKKMEYVIYKGFKVLPYERFAKRIGIEY